MKFTIAPLIGLGLLLSGCNNTPNYDYDKSVNFSGFATYAWVVESNHSGSEQDYFNSDINNKRIINAIERELTAKGMRKVAPNEASVLVNFNTAINRKREQVPVNTHPFYLSFGHGYQGTRWFGLDYPVSRSSMYMNLNSGQREFKEGSLVVDFIKPNKELVWRGSFDTRLHKKSTPEKLTEKVNLAVAEILMNFPPK